MIGGYLSFTGFGGAAHYKGTEIEAIMPVELLTYDDRVERPEGAFVKLVAPGHEIFAGIDGEFPFFMGYNRLLPGDGEVLAEINGDPFISVRNYEKGRTLAFASDMSPHWGPPEFVGWKYYSRLIANMIRFIAKK